MVEVETVIMVVERLDNRLVALVIVYGIVVVTDVTLPLVEITEIAEVVDVQSVA